MSLPAHRQPQPQQWQQPQRRPGNHQKNLNQHHDHDHDRHNHDAASQRKSRRVDTTQKEWEEWGQKNGAQDATRLEPLVLFFFFFFLLLY